MSIACLSVCHGGQSEARKCGALVAFPDHKDLPALAASNKAPVPWVRARSFQQSYQLGQILGQGAFAVVHEGTQVIPPHQSYAVKVVQRGRMNRKQLTDFKNEVQILASLQPHPGIVQFVELCKEPDFFFVVQEKLGGELFDRLVELHTYREADARDVMRSMLEAIAYCHSQRVAHRDLKPENLLLKDSGNDTAIKVADFGFAKRVEKPNSLTTLCGSPMYIAPEIINYHPYDQRVDLWSLGVILYTILGGYPPFDEPTIHATYQQVRQANYEFSSDYDWDGVSPDAKNLIRSLLEVNPDQRLTAEQALDHAWMTGRGDSGFLWNRQLSKKSRERFQSFNSQRKRAQNKGVKSVSMYWLVSRR